MYDALTHLHLKSNNSSTCLHLRRPPTPTIDDFELIDEARHYFQHAIIAYVSYLSLFLMLTSSSV